MDVHKTEAEAGAEASVIDIQQYARAIWRRKLLVLGVLAACVVAMVVYTLRQPRLFASSATVIMDSSAPRVLDRDVEEVVSDERSNYWFNKEYSQTQLHILKSRAVASRVVDKLGLQSDSAFLGLNRLQDEQKRAESMKRVDAVALLMARIKVTLEKDSRMVSIRVEDVDTEPCRASRQRSGRSLPRRESGAEA